MNCKELNIELCLWCQEPFPIEHPNDCWVHWWKEQFSAQSDIKKYISDNIKRRNMQEFHFIYFMTAIKQYQSEYFDYATKLQLLI